MINEAIKNRIILIIGIACVMLFVWDFGVTSELSKVKKDMKNEMRLRLEFEEQNISFLKEKTSFEDKIKKLTADLENNKAALEELKKSLDEELLASKTLKSELDKITKLKAAMEEDLKEALANNAREQKKR
ncbi:MAG: hypothetical protein COV72_06375 [Candidatus Omnitrophica bacterium CG11_big_fil_rev_8_21_14_0_20_42_13]|uniref:Uncharacterized protein n=1 Tax=Candidatus Ghiorseimicrobium undicola TaxID=1974746 RepID=A0A2H0LWW6_9BACT|nr:MAG: hypothetical protein COV72_06375 [Candidatus Omnitrophica bacterium CG11_big_fil_rev_8_21_14_0_20_42_13]